MIAKASKPGKGFRGILDYAESHGTLIASNMLGQNARELSKEFGISRRQLPGRKSPVFHTAISLPPGEHLSDVQFTELAQEYLQKLGYENSQHCIYRHSDREHEHIHVIASRISLDGKWINDAHEYRRSEKICRELEVTHGLTRVNVSGAKPARKALVKAEIERSERLEVQPPRQRIADSIDAILIDSRQITFEDFQEKLAGQGITVKLNVQSTGRIFGISFSAGETAFSGGKIGNGYTLGSLQQKGLKIMTDKENKIEVTTHVTLAKAGADTVTQTQKKIWTFEEVLEATKFCDPLPADFDQWDMRDSFRGKPGTTVAHIAAIRGVLPAKFEHWEWIDENGKTVAETAVRFDSLPADFNQWGVKTKDGITLAEMILELDEDFDQDYVYEDSATPEQRAVAQAWLDEQKFNDAKQAVYAGELPINSDTEVKPTEPTKKGIDGFLADLDEVMAHPFRYMLKKFLKLLEVIGKIDAQEAQRINAMPDRMTAKMPSDFKHWTLADKDGKTIAHLAAEFGALPDNFIQWGLADKNGKTVADIALASKDTSPALQTSVRAWLEQHKPLSAEAEQFVDESKGKFNSILEQAKDIRMLEYIKSLPKDETEPAEQVDEWIVSPRRHEIQKDLEKILKNAPGEQNRREILANSLEKIDEATPDEREKTFEAITGTLAKQFGRYVGR